ncbi:tRNA uridine-5-carboxymethylaminomethyl(34) synthesis GTPase MnmE [Geoalkalibacter subterraneus]|uniref:tRNA uridine-5-carboxymethylaminomethyl(34) synthesis GTPase MnmE n=1 Tax=Geoalkalibacter subterraneus TaxID=483547 RepID=UPI0006935E1C|nr:tRNA uridine-5-carboxymethylaminomethyl(34) synthesis GTPase MnmE [Geoalkalibacter subterraneus]
MSFDLPPTTRSKEVAGNRPQGEDIIVAPATSFGQGGIGIIRLSGPGCLDLVRPFVLGLGGGPPSWKSHRLYYGQFTDSSQRVIDEVMAVYMASPRSYTREDVVEIHCHGGLVVGRRILETLRHAGARTAQPGEFTLRAFLNGRIDLTQAEGVMEVIEARHRSAHQIAVQHLEGSLAHFCNELREQLLDSLALLETWIDFPEEDIDHPSFDSIVGTLTSVIENLRPVVASFRNGRVLREGVSVLILGKPNVGKSSLLNALVGSDRAIVTDLPGTTRDTLEEQLDLDGLRLRLTDTAGLRDSDDPVEQEGVRRACGKIAQADIVLLVIDGHRGMDDDDRSALGRCAGKNSIIVINKSDLPSVEIPSLPSHFPVITVSAATGAGIDRLREELRIRAGIADGEECPESLILTEERHHQALSQTLEKLGKTIESLNAGLSPEFIALDLREAVESLGVITGETAPEEVINRIFSRFCIGK